MSGISEIERKEQEAKDRASNKKLLTEDQVLDMFTTLARKHVWPAKQSK